MDAKAIRRMNARQLAEEVGGVTTLATMTGTSQSYLSQIIGPKPCRDVGDNLARKLEQATGRPYGWMDVSHVTDARKENARKVYDALLDLPEEKVGAILALLNLGPASSSVVDLGEGRDQRTTRDKPARHT